MKSSLRIALVAAVLAANCGGAEEPPAQPPAASTSVPQVETTPPEKPAPPPTPPSETAPADKPVARAEPAAVAPKAPVAPKTPPARPAYTRTDLQVGTGQEAQKGRRLSVHYTGWLYDPAQPEMKGRMFDSSRERGPFDFQLGAGQVIPGWDQGFDGMKIGGRRRLIIPPTLAYGVDGAGNGIIPPNATLLFEMELLGVQ